MEREQNLEQQLAQEEQRAEELKELNLSMADFFKQCGFSRATYYNITAKPSSMTLEQIDNICKMYNFDVQDY